VRKQKRRVSDGKKKEIDDDYNKWYAKKLEFSKNFCDRMTVRTK